jgi:hypothetical protein
MKIHRPLPITLGSAVLAAALGVGLAPGYDTNDAMDAKDTTMTATMTKRAQGSFDVKVGPEAQEEFPGGTSLGRFSLDKQYHGDLEAVAKGEMLTAGTAVEGSAGYVAMERVDGTLHGRRGTFVLQHLGSMGHGTQQLTIAVVPDSGTGELVGLAGQLDIRITDGQHFYELAYTLPETP